jgi:hypothetical protein
MNTDFMYSLWFFLLFYTVVFALAILFLAVPVFAFSYGSNYNYSAVVEVNNSYVHQGQNISQGNYYDLSGVYGWTGILGHWKDEYSAGYLYPDDSIDLNVGNIHKVYIDPLLVPTGKWYQLDKNRDSDGYMFQNGNSYVFYVVPIQTSSAKIIERAAAIPTQYAIINSTVYIWNGSVSVEVPVTIQIPQTVPTTELPANVHTIIIPTTSQQEPTPTSNFNLAPIKVVTPRTPMPIYLSLLALISLVILCRRI